MSRKSSARAAGRRTRALVVEDDGLLALSVEQALRDAGIAEVAVCADIASAMTELDRGVPDILVLDVRLADRDDGWTLAELVQEMCPVPPCIVFSTGLPENIPDRVAHLGTVLVKPYGPQALVAAIEPKRAGVLARLRAAIGGS